MTMPPDARRERLWLEMANQFLDGEERPNVPLIALAALDAGLTIDQTHRVWMYEVAPALSLNLWSVAGVWGAWDPAFVIQRVRASRSDPSRHHFWAGLGYYLSMAPFLGIWRTIEQCMRVLSEVEGAARAERAHDLVWLAGHFFDFLWTARRTTATDLPRLARTYQKCFDRAMGPSILSSDERRAGDERVRKALAP